MLVLVSPTLGDQVTMGRVAIPDQIARPEDEHVEFVEETPMYISIAEPTPPLHWTDCVQIDAEEDLQELAGQYTIVSRMPYSAVHSVGDQVISLAECSKVPDSLSHLVVQGHLSGAVLTGANLDSCDLRRAKVVGGDLTGANLNKANLRETNLSWSTLRQASLTNCNLFQAQLQWSNASGADMSGAVLINAEMLRTNLRQVNLRGALMPDGKKFE